MAALPARLRARRAEVEQAILSRVTSLSGLPDAAGPEYAAGLRDAVAAAVEYAIEGIERGSRGAPRTPDALLSQARLAARSGVSLDTVLRRYVAGHALLSDFAFEEAARADALDPSELKRLMRLLAAVVDTLLAAVSDAYVEEAERRPQSAERRRAELIERLLNGEPLDPSELRYDLGVHHLGLLVAGPGKSQAAESLARLLHARPLTLVREEGVLWAWLGRRAPFDPDELLALAEEVSSAEVVIALGEPGEGRAGWSLTHRQARAAFQVAARSHRTPVRYADVALLASVLQDDLLSASLRALYLESLEADRDGGAALRETLSAYFATERNVSSTAAALGVTRNTVASRLRKVEQRIGRPLNLCGTDLEVALRLEEAEEPPPTAGLGTQPVEHTAGSAGDS